MPPPTSLFLAPQDPFAAPACADVLDVLDELEVIGAEIGPARYAAGTGFSRHVVYAGCSPYLVTSPPADGSLAFCHVALHGPYPAPRLVTGPNTVKPRCPTCRARFDHWREQLPSWIKGTETPRCSACGAQCSVHRLDWRGHALSGRVLIELRNVFPGEACPSDLLLYSLAECCGQPWRYGWAAYLLD